MLILIRIRMLRILSNTDVESDREKRGKTNSDISTLVPHYNRIRIRIRISILGANTDTDAKNSDNHFHIPTLSWRHVGWNQVKNDFRRSPVWYHEIREFGRTILLFWEEKRIPSIVEGCKKDFPLTLYPLVQAHMGQHTYPVVSFELLGWAEIVRWPRKKSFLPPSTLSRICFSPLDHKIVRPASSDSQNRSHNLPERFEGEVAAGFLFFFYFLFWLNFWKITINLKNYKRENLILLNSM